jgi:hypothetical protein
MKQPSTGLEYARMAFMTFGERIYGELSRKAEELAVPACAVKATVLSRHALQLVPGTNANSAAEHVGALLRNGMHLLP